MRTFAFLGLVAISFYHVLNILKVFDGSLVWGGYINEYQTLLILETMALFITIYLAYIVYELRRSFFISRAIQIGLKVGIFVFFFSTIGNLLANNLVEKIVCSSIAFFYTVYFYFENKNAKEERIS
jgi:hypothetical protein